MESIAWHFFMWTLDLRGGILAADGSPRPTSSSKDADALQMNWSARAFDRFGRTMLDAAQGLQRWDGSSISGLAPLRCCCWFSESSHSDVAQFS